MMRANHRILALALVMGLTGAYLLAPRPAQAASAAEIDRDATAALENLYAASPEAKMLGREAKAILVFPRIVKAGFLFGGQYGDGAMFEHGQPVGYFTGQSQVSSNRDR